MHNQPECLKKFVWNLPKENRVLFRRVLELFIEIAACSDSNRMSLSNISICSSQIFALKKLPKGKLQTLTADEFQKEVAAVTKMNSLMYTALEKFNDIFDMVTYLLNHG